ncbi:uncharacterized protein DFL_003674 [Arthrobotrys flagrans]|uniref:Ig-like domain-containing protein n=1 Tax=Arthrobotrys flagrans TaxID=97331 RepID=A0A437A2N8_ARTFL|nr:hypothetical protein DFL_003674 [Arthrobotrys flagrans]
MIFPEAFLGLFIRFILIRGVEGNPETIAIPGNTSDTRPPITAAADSCCFVVQDRIDDYYWRRYTFTVTETVHAVTTHVSIYPTGRVTNIETSTYTRINPTYRPPAGEFYESLYRVNDPLRPPRGYEYNKAPGVKVRSTQLGSKDGTKIVTAGTTVFSPSAFNVYNSFKIITVPPVTDSNGNSVCVTASSHPNHPDMGIPGSRKFTGLNTYAQAYYGVGICTLEIIPFTETIEDDDNGTGATTKTSVTTGAVTLDCTYTPTGGPKPSVVTEITLTKPYVRIPPASETISFDSIGCTIANNVPQEMWGYFPQDVIDYIVSDPSIRSQYPDITKCLAGGPQIFPQTVFHCDRPQVLEPQITLTSYDEEVITIGSEFFPTTGGSGSRTREPAQVDTTTTAAPSNSDPSKTARPNPTDGQPVETNPSSRSGTPSDNQPVDEPPSSQSSGSSPQNPTSDSTPGQPSDSGSPQGTGSIGPSSLSTATTNPGAGNTSPATDTPSAAPPNNSGTSIVAPRYFFQLAAFVSFLATVFAI